jgi:hypothetical protein
LYGVALDIQVKMDCIKLSDGGAAMTLKSGSNAKKHSFPWCYSCHSCDDSDACTTDIFAGCFIVRT